MPDNPDVRPGHPELPVTRRTADEPIIGQDGSILGSLTGFWEWSSSDLAANTIRGVLAEYFVALALGQADDVRRPWDPFDLKTESGTRIEVKSASRWQTWFQKEPSRLAFTISPTREWSSATNELSPEARRQADVYVFCVLDAPTKGGLNPLDLRQWRFWVLPARALDDGLPQQKQISLPGLLRLGAKECAFGTLASSIEGSLVNK